MSAYMKRFLGIMSIIIAIGLAYALITHYTGFAIPCFFRQITGLQCPACGVSRMCLRMLEFQFEDAFYCNPFLFCTFPFIIFQIYMHARYGTKEPKWNLRLELIYLIALLIFGVARNVWAYI